MTAVLVRVELGVSYDHNTSRTANSTTNFGRHIPFTPVPSKLKQSVSTFGLRSDDDDP